MNFDEEPSFGDLTSNFQCDQWQDSANGYQQDYSNYDADSISFYSLNEIQEVEDFSVLDTDFGDQIQYDIFQNDSDPISKIDMDGSLTRKMEYLESRYNEKQNEDHNHDFLFKQSNVGPILPIPLIPIPPVLRENDSDRGKRKKSKLLSPQQTDQAIQAFYQELRKVTEDQSLFTPLTPIFTESLVNFLIRLTGMNSGESKFPYQLGIKVIKAITGRNLSSQKNNNWWKEMEKIENKREWFKLIGTAENQIKIFLLCFEHLKGHDGSKISQRAFNDISEVIANFSRMEKCF